MYCDKCGAELKEGITYCNSCGAKSNESVAGKREIPSKKRTTGLSILAIYFITVGLFSILLIGFMLILLIGTLINVDYISRELMDTSFDVLIMGIVMIIVGLGSLCTGYGLWTLKKWARNLAIILPIISMIIEISASFFTNITAPTFESIIVNIIIIAIIIWYVSKPEIKKLFEI